MIFTGGTATAIDGRVELGALGSGQPSRVGLETHATGWELDYGEVETFGDITLSQQSAAYVSSTTTAGSMQIAGRQLTVTDGSIVLVQNFGAVPGEQLQVTMSESIDVIGIESNTLLHSQIGTEVFGTAKGADVVISTSRLETVRKQALSSLFVLSFSSPPVIS